MSLPISQCMIFKAARDREYTKLKERIEYNLQFGSFTFVNCKHNPKCSPPSEKELMELFQHVPKLSIIIAQCFPN